MRALIQHIAIRLRRMLLLALFSPAALLAQPALTTQELTLQVMEVNKIDVSRRALALVVDHSSKATGEVFVVENQDGALIWTTNGSQKKITIASSTGSTRYTLKIVASMRDGSTQSTGPEITILDEQSHDLLVGLPRGAGRCSIKYVATASLERGPGSEVQTLTYTITAT